MNVLLGKAVWIPWADLGEVAVDASDLTATLHREDGTEVAELEAAATEVPDLYVFGEWTPLDTFVREVRFVYDGTVLGSEPVRVDQQPPVDAQADQAFHPHTAAAGLPEPDELVEARVFRRGPSGEYMSDTLSASFQSARNVYRTDDELELPAGLYGVAWYVDGTLLRVQCLTVGRTGGKESVRVRLRGETTGAPHTATKLVLSKPDGTWVAQETTDVEGKAVLRAPPGDYILTAVKTGVVFNLNNFRLPVSNTEITTDRNQTTILVDTFEPTVAHELPDVPVCELEMTLRTMSGTPLPHAEVQITALSGPAVLIGMGVFGVRQGYRTDSLGYLSMQLVRGLSVEILIAPLGVRRQIQVPDEAGPVNLLTLLEQANDPFTILRPSLPAAPRRGP